MNWAQHSVLKRVMEQDSPAGHAIVLAVAAIRQPSLRQPAAALGAGPGADSGAAPAAGLPPQLVLTDGWYWISAALDAPLAARVRTGQLRVGGCSPDILCVLTTAFICIVSKAMLMEDA